MKVLDTYSGGKNGSGTYQKIINQIPPHRVYIEPFLGGGGVFLRKSRAEINIGNELDPLVYTKWVEADIPELILFNAHAVDLLKAWFEHQSEDDTVIYLDPPYPMDSRKNSKTDLYNFEMTDEDHRQLLSYLLTLKCKILISTYKNPIYAEMLAGWPLITFTSSTRRGPATEYLYMNFENPENQLHEYTYVGEDFREREMIKKGVTGFKKRLEKMTARQRNAYVAAVLELHLQRGPNG